MKNKKHPYRLSDATLEQQIAAARPALFRAGFSDRVMQRLRTQQSNLDNFISASFSVRLAAAFKPFAIASAAAILLLMLLNLAPVTGTVQTVDDVIDQTFVLSLEELL